MALSNNFNLKPFLDRLTSRSVLTSDEQAAILALPGRIEQVQANRDFVRMGERVDHVCFVAAGLVGRFDQNANGSRQITAIHIPGDTPDLHSAVQPQATSALQALSVATILRIPHSAVRNATAKHHALAEALWRDCMVDSAILSQWVVNVGRRDARARIAHLLCEIAVRLEATNDLGTFSFPFDVTQTQIADSCGLTVVHVNRVLKVLRDNGLADVRRRQVHVLDWEALQAAGDFDPAYLQVRIPPEQRLRIVPPMN
jgi:CRP-like cAMP-binding protein